MSQKVTVLCQACVRHIGLPTGRATRTIVETRHCKLCDHLKTDLLEFVMDDEMEKCLENRRKNLEFVEEMICSLRVDLKTKILEGRIPRTWSGKQLRKLIADKAKEMDYNPMTRSELAAYTNDVLVNNL